MTETELPITGYLDRFSHRPGETFTARVSVRDGGAYRARLVRVLSGDPNPDGPGMRFEDHSHRFDRSFAGRRQPIRLGSYGRVGAGPVRDAKAACTWTVLVHPGVVHPGQVLLAEETGDASIALLVGANGATARITSAGATVELATGASMQAARWYRVWLAADPASGRVLVGQHPLDGSPVTAEMSASALALPSGGAVLFAAGNAAAPDASFHRPARGSRDPARLHHLLARCRRIAADASRRPAGRLGFLARHRHPGDPRHRSARMPRPTGEHADARDGRHALERARAVLASCARRLRRDPFPCRRPGRLRLGRGLHLDRAGRYAQRRLCAASDLRRRRGLAAALRAAAPTRTVRADRVPGLDLHLSGLCQPRAHQH